MDKELEYKAHNNFSEALSRFNFTKVYDTMCYLGWTWGLDSHSPSKKQMIDMIKELFEVAIDSFNNEESSVCSGGFLVRISKTGQVTIQFILTQSYSYQ